MCKAMSQHPYESTKNNITLVLIYICRTKAEATSESTEAGLGEKKNQLNSQRNPAQDVLMNE